MSCVKSRVRELVSSRAFAMRVSRLLVDPTYPFKLLLRLVSSVVPHDDFVPFLVLCSARTGSNLLNSRLNYHPRVRALGEICALRRDRSVRDMLRPAFGPQPRVVAAAGFKLFYDHPRDDTSNELRAALARLPALHVIHLTRANLLESIVSHGIAGVSQTWMEGSVGRRSRRPILVSLSPGTVLRRIGSLRMQTDRARADFATHPLLEITYEELVARPRHTMDRVFRFLGTTPVRTATYLRKQRTAPLSHTIANYAEVAMRLREAGYTSLLGPEDGS